ncbi:MAG: class I SAM-dependent methyltransferase [Polyangiaceae bacterium]|nr:class I SAM-dependent methyltransferase [Polyangiaceae bacterium]
MTRSPEQWEQRYLAGDLPWDTGRPDRELERLVAARALAPCRALEVGCGTGTNAIWLAERGFEVFATDLAPTAIARARAKAERADVRVRFEVGSFPAGEPPFDLAYDRGCFHVHDEAAERAAFAASVAAALAPAGLWLSLIGSSNGPPREVGPPRRSARDVAEALEPHFELLLLEDTTFEADLPSVPRAWLCLARRRASAG